MFLTQLPFFFFLTSLHFEQSWCKTLSFGMSTLSASWLQIKWIACLFWNALFLFWPLYLNYLNIGFPLFYIHNAYNLESQTYWHSQFYKYYKIRHDIFTVSSKHSKIPLWKSVLVCHSLGLISEWNVYKEVLVLQDLIYGGSVARCWL